MTNLDQALAEQERRLAAADWRDVLAGYYAVELVDDEEPFDSLGHVLYERRVPRTNRNGRSVGRDVWRRRVMPAAGADLERLRWWLDDYDERHDIAELIDAPDHYRAKYGRLTGHCGYCGRTLTDAGSKMAGIGPECVKNTIGGAAA